MWLFTKSVFRFTYFPFKDSDLLGDNFLICERQLINNLIFTYIYIYFHKRRNLYIIFYIDFSSLDKILFLHKISQIAKNLQCIKP